MKIRLLSLLSFIILLFGSLRSYYFVYLGGVRWFLILSLLILIIILPTYKINKKAFVFATIFIILFFFNVFLSFFNFDLIPHYNSYIGFILAPLFFLVFFSFFYQKPRLLILNLRRVLKFHLFFFYLQLFVFLIFKYRLDFLVFITNDPQRTIGGIFTEKTIIRTCGLFNEPASYAIFAISTLFCILTYSRKIDKLLIATILSIILSFSASGVMYLGVILFIFYFKMEYFKKGIFYISASIIMLGLLIVNYFFGNAETINRFLNKIANFQESESYKFRIGNVFNVFEHLSIFKKVFGIGYGNIEISKNLGSFLSQFIVQSGILFSSLFCLLFIWLFSVFKLQKKTILILAILTTSTQAINHLVTWYFLAIILIFQYNKTYEDSASNFRTR